MRLAAAVVVHAGQSMDAPTLVALELQAEVVDVTDAEEILPHQHERHFWTLLPLIEELIVFDEDAARTERAGVVGHLVGHQFDWIEMALDLLSRPRKLAADPFVFCPRLEGIERGDVRCEGASGAGTAIWGATPAPSQPSPVFGS